MKHLVPYPLLVFLLIIMWMMLTRFSLGYFVLGSVIALLAGKAVETLHPETPRIHAWYLIPHLILKLCTDIICSNIAVTRFILTEGWSNRKSGIIEIPLSLKSRTALAILAVILTATPGTAWLEYAPETGVLTLHIFDGSKSEQYMTAIHDGYEPLLKEIFE